MSNELVVSSTQNGCRIALLKDKGLLEYHREEDGSQFTVGEIYLGTVKKVVPGLNAAFIDVGYQKDAFLHYLDLGPKIGPAPPSSVTVPYSKPESNRFTNII